MKAVTYVYGHNFMKNNAIEIQMWTELKYEGQKHFLKSW